MTPEPVKALAEPVTEAGKRLFSAIKGGTIMLWAYDEEGQAYIAEAILAIEAEALMHEVELHHAATLDRIAPDEENSKDFQVVVEPATVPPTGLREALERAVIDVALSHGIKPTEFVAAMRRVPDPEPVDALGVVLDRERLGKAIA